MIIKAIIESNSIDNQYRVRIPKYHKLSRTPGSTPTSGLPLASVCHLPGIVPTYAIGDIVFIDFENNDLSFPVILGKLLSDNNNLEESVSDVKTRSLTVDVDTKLSDDTKIGSINYNDLQLAVQSVII